MITFSFETLYDDEGSRADMVIAPDRETAVRLAAKQTLDDNSWTLEDRGCKSLESFYDGPASEPGEHMEIHAEWEDLKGTACPNCTAHCGQDDSEGETIAGVRVKECNSCGYRWVPLGFGERRHQLEQAALFEIASLDEYERQSLGETEEEDA